MTPTELRAARERLGLIQADLAKALRLGKHGGRTVRRWELAEAPIPGPVAVAIELLLKQRGLEICNELRGQPSNWRALSEELLSLLDALGWNKDDDADDALTKPPSRGSSPEP